MVHQRGSALERSVIDRPSEIGDWVTNLSGDMGDSCWRGGSLALEGHVTHAVEQSVHRRVLEEGARRFGAVPTIPSEAEDGLQMDRPVLGGVRAGRAVSKAAHEPARDLIGPCRSLTGVVISSTRRT